MAWQKWSGRKRVPAGIADAPGPASPILDVDPVGDLRGDQPGMQRQQDEPCIA